jgi:hypothetical protein
MKNRKYATVLIILLAVPALFFLIFMVGEVLGGDISGLSHLLQAAPFLILIYFVWKKSYLKKNR